MTRGHYHHTPVPATVRTVVGGVVSDVGSTKRVIAQAVGPGVALVDSAEASSAAVVDLLSSRAQLATGVEEPVHRYYVTDVPEDFVRVGERFLGHSIRSAEQVDIA